MNDNSEVTINPDYFFKEDAAVMTLTKFEYFAGLAMQGILGVDGSTPLSHISAVAVAEKAVEIAKALITELAKEGRDV